MKRNTVYTEKRAISQAGSLGLLYVEGSVTTSSVLAVPQYSVTMEKRPEDLLQKMDAVSRKSTFVFGVIVELILMNRHHQPIAHSNNIHKPCYMFVSESFLI